MNIQSMYSDIDLDANGMETEFQAAFEELLWFINQRFQQQGRWAIMKALNCGRSCSTVTF